MNWSARASLRPASSSYDRRTLRSAFSVDTGQHTGYIFRSIVCRSRAFIFGHLFGDSFAHLFGQPAARGTSGLKSLATAAGSASGCACGSLRTTAPPWPPGPGVASHGSLPAAHWVPRRNDVLAHELLLAYRRLPRAPSERQRAGQTCGACMGGTQWHSVGTPRTLRGTPGHSGALRGTP